MGRSKRGDKEYTKEQRLVKENRQLKQELAHLRKQISRLDVNRFETVREMCADYEEKQRFEENVGPIGQNLESLKKEWSCRDCKVGWLEIILYSKLGQTFYYRKCNSCDNRTRGQRYDENSVKGLKKSNSSMGDKNE